jgi:hypothetical protein
MSTKGSSNALGHFFRHHLHLFHSQRRAISFQIRDDEANERKEPFVRLRNETFTRMPLAHFNEVLKELTQFILSTETNDFSRHELFLSFFFCICHIHSGSSLSSLSLPNGMVLND